MRKLLVALVVMMSFGAMAQSKIGHVNSQKLLDTLPSRKAALKELSDFEARGYKELEDMNTELEKMYNKYVAERETLSQTLREYEEARIQKKQSEMQARQQELDQEMTALSNKLNAPILQRMQKAVDIVAERKKLNYVIDETVTLYSKAGVDLTAEVMTELLRIDAEETKKP